MDSDDPFPTDDGGNFWDRERTPEQRKAFDEFCRQDGLEKRYRYPTRSLDLRDLPNAVTDADMAQIALFPEIREINLTHAAITDQGMAELLAHTGLDELHLSHTAIGDPGMRFVGRLRKLQLLGLDWTQVTDEGVKPLAGMPDLFYLDVSGTAVTDAVLDVLCEFPMLHELEMVRTGITDVGLRRLADEVPQLTRVRVGAPHLSLEALNYLVQAKDEVEWLGDDRYVWDHRLTAYVRNQ